VYLGAIAQIRSYPEQFQIDAPLLHRMFAEMELEQEHYKTAMSILLCSLKLIIYCVNFIILDYFS
jgi:hypothetical protein